MKKDNTYPTNLEVYETVGSGFVRRFSNEQYMVNSVGAIKVVVEVDGSDYPKALVQEAVREICQKVPGYFG